MWALDIKTFVKNVAQYTVKTFVNYFYEIKILFWKQKVSTHEPDKFDFTKFYSWLNFNLITGSGINGTQDF